MGTQSVFAQDKKMLKAAQKGNTEAIANLASCYYRGLSGFEKNEEQANYWANKALEAAKNGAWDCQFWIIGRYLYGDFFVEKDIYKAKEWADILITNPKLPSNERSSALRVKNDIDKEIKEDIRIKEQGQNAQREAEMAQRKAKEVLKDPLKVGELAIQIIDKDLPISKAEALVSHLIKMEDSPEKKQALKSVIRKCQLMGTGYDPDNDSYLSMSHEGTEKGRQEMALAAKIQEYLIESGDMNELIDYAYRCRQNGQRETAKKYFLLAAEKGNAMAMRGLAFCYSDENNSEKAIEWYTKLLKTNANEQFTVDAMEYFRKINRSDLIYKALESSASNNNKDACLRLGDIYRYGHDWDFKKSGISVQKNYATAIKWYEKAREAGSKAALFFMADCYWKGGYGVTQNRVMAGKLYEKLMNEAGLLNLKITEAEPEERSVASYQFGVCLETGAGVVKNMNRAWNFYCDSDEADAYYRRGVMVQKRWVKETLLPSVRVQLYRQLYQEAARKGHEKAKQALNNSYK